MDSPGCTVAATALEDVDLVRDANADYSADERRQILRDTAESVYLAKVGHQR
jgi:hypothetical protein